MKKLIKNKRNIKMILTSIFVFLFFNINQVTAYASNARVSSGFETAIKDFVTEYKLVFSGVAGFAILTSIGIFIYHFCQLSASSSNPQKRAEAINNLLVTGICVALLGAIPLIVVLLFKVTN